MAGEAEAGGMRRGKNQLKLEDKRRHDIYVL